ncbi:MAG: MBL fold metallo-hydrolase, partial [Coriobacteriia bacterium]|nr:MBL fold metallo-hydrolase [Coriobacteriia bacterium]
TVLSVIALWWFWPRLGRSTLTRLKQISKVLLIAFLALSVSVSLLPFAHISDQVVILDVGQGDAVLLRSGIHTILVDTGPDPGILERQLRKQRVDTIEALILTHDHDDHIGGVKALSRYGPVRWVLCAEGAQSSPQIRQIASDLDAELREVKLGDEIILDKLSIHVWGPLDKVIDPGANESCLVLYVTTSAGKESRRFQFLTRLGDRSARIESSSLLMSGDAEALSVKRAFMAQQRETHSVDVIKLGHHGSKESINEGLLELLDPQYVVISVGKNNAYGHPAQSTLDLCDGREVHVLRTDQSGTITVDLESQTMIDP